MLLPNCKFNYFQFILEYKVILQSIIFFLGILIQTKEYIPSYKKLKSKLIYQNNNNNKHEEKPW
jgi:hypothetical protein